MSCLQLHHTAHLLVSNRLLKLFIKTVYITNQFALFAHALLFSIQQRINVILQEIKMVTKRRGKRKNDSKNLVFEVSDSDVSPDDSDNEDNEPHRKVLKTESKFVESVVNALSNLENEAKIETKASRSNADKEKIIILDESIGEITEKSSEIENEINSQISKPDEEDIIKLDLDDSNDGSFKDHSEHLDESVIVLGDDTLCEIKTNNECLVQNEDCTLMVLEGNCSNEHEECSNSNKDTEQIIGCKSPNVLDTSAVTDIEEGELTAEIDNVDAVEPEISINFSSKSISDLYKSKFLDFINTCTDLSIVKQDDLTITALKYVHNNSPTTFEENDNTHIHESEQSPRKKKKRKKAKKEKELFTLDTKPCENVNNITQYSSKFQISENSSEEVLVSLQICFNCDQNHALKDCTLPKNYAKINQKRQQLKMTREKQASRYHLEEDQKYDHLKPGKISNKLREALGLKSNQIPSYIYQMRILGYPPGWLEEAKVVYSNLALFDSDGKYVRPENLKKNQGLDPNKIIEYPGFNAPMDRYSKDEHRLYRVPSYSNKYSKNSMIEYFEKEYSKLQDDFETLDMDLDGTNDDNGNVEPQNIMTCLPKDVYKDVQSPSLIDLETQKQNLLEALDDSFSSNLKFEANIEKEPPPSGLESQDELSANQTDKTDQSPSNTVKELSETNYLASPSNSTNNSILNSDYGTPILKSCSPFSRLPNPVNFMKDVSPVINFENLPNSTGKYEKMTGLLQKVRSTLKDIQKKSS